MKGIGRARGKLNIVTGKIYGIQGTIDRLGMKE